MWLNIGKKLIFLISESEEGRKMVSREGKSAKLHIEKESRINLTNIYHYRCFLKASTEVTKM